MIKKFKTYIYIKRNTQIMEETNEEFNIIEYKDYRSGLIQVILTEWFKKNQWEPFSEDFTGEIQLELKKHLNFKTTVSIKDKTNHRTNGIVVFVNDEEKEYVVDFCVLNTGTNFNNTEFTV